MNQKLTGIYAALLTPFDREGRILYAALQHHVDYLVRQGIKGFYVNGTTGESFLMSGTERKKVLEAVVEANAGRATVICHCGAIGTELSADLVRHSDGLPVDAVSAVPPFYYKFSEKEILGYYFDLANASGKPFIVYNLPKYSGVVITPEMMKQLRLNTHIQGLKFTHTDFAAIQALKAADPDLIIYNGFDEMCICGMAMGCDGAIGSTYNVIAPLVMRLSELCRQNDYHGALRVQYQMNALIADMTIHGKHLALTKYLISRIEGIDYGVSRKPFDELNDQEKDVAESILERLETEL